jgi:hypothetical protein
MIRNEFLTDSKVRTIVTRFSKELQWAGLDLVSISVDRTYMPDPDGVGLTITFQWKDRQGMLLLEVPFDDDLEPHIEETIRRWREMTDQEEVR